MHLNSGIHCSIPKGGVFIKIPSILAYTASDLSIKKERVFYETQVICTHSVQWRGWHSRYHLVVKRRFSPISEERRERQPFLFMPRMSRVLWSGGGCPKDPVFYPPLFLVPGPLYDGARRICTVPMFAMYPSVHHSVLHTELTMWSDGSRTLDRPQLC